MDDLDEALIAFVSARMSEDERRVLDKLLPAVIELDDIAYGEGQGPADMPHGEPPLFLLKLLALRDADHADYRQEWRPVE